MSPIMSIDRRSPRPARAAWRRSMRRRTSKRTVEGLCRGEARGSQEVGRRSARQRGGGEAVTGGQYEVPRGHYEGPKGRGGGAEKVRPRQATKRGPLRPWRL